MKLPRRNFLHLVAGAAALPAVSRWHGAELSDKAGHDGGDVPAGQRVRHHGTHPGRPPFRDPGPAGRRRSNRRRRRYDRRSRAARAAPDGYQFVLGATDTLAQTPTLYKNPAYNSVADFTPVGLIVEQPFLVVARNDLPADDLQGFIAYAKANQADMKFGSAGPASGSHFACASLNAAIGISVTAIPYRGATQGLQDVIAGRIDYYCPISAAAVAHLENRTMKAIAVLSRNRSDVLPKLASAHEQGLTDFEATYWNGVFVPKDTPAPVVAKLHDAFVATIDTPAMQAKLKEIGVTVVAPERRSPDYLRKFLASEIERWAGPIKASGVSLD